MPFNLHVFLLCIQRGTGHEEDESVKDPHRIYDRETLELQAVRIRKEHLPYQKAVDQYWVPNEPFAVSAIHYLRNFLADENGNTKESTPKTVAELAAFQPKGEPDKRGTELAKHTRELYEWVRASLPHHQAPKAAKRISPWRDFSLLSSAHQGKYIPQDPEEVEDEHESEPIDRCHVIMADVQTIEILLYDVFGVLSKPTNGDMESNHLDPGSLSTVHFSARTKRWRIHRMNVLD